MSPEELQERAERNERIKQELLANHQLPLQQQEALAAIARRLKVSKNIVVGLNNRLGLSIPQSSPIRRPRDQDKRDRVIELLKQGDLLHKQIAAAVGWSVVSVSRLSSRLQREGVRLPRGRRTAPPPLQRENEAPAAGAKAGNDTTSPHRLDARRCAAAPRVRGMRFRQCQFIQSEERPYDDSMKCGRPTDGGPWCEEHRARCLVRPAKAQGDAA